MQIVPLPILGKTQGIPGRGNSLCSPETILQPLLRSESPDPHPLQLGTLSLWPQGKWEPTHPSPSLAPFPGAGAGQGLPDAGDVSTRPQKHRQTLKTTMKTSSRIAHTYSKETHTYKKIKNLV